MTAPLVLLNARAGGGRAGRLAAAMAAWLARRGLRLAVTSGVAEAVRALQALPRGSRVVLGGGDGSLQRLLPALLDGEHALGLVPCGSGNDAARAFGLHGLPWPDALEHALAAAATPVDLGELLPGAPGEATVPFASSLAIGFDGAVTHRAQALPPVLRGLPRYLLATLATLAALRPEDARVVLDGAVVHDGPLLFASLLNTPTYGSGMPIAPGAQVDDGRLDLVVAGRFGRLQALAMLPRLLAGRHLGHPRVGTARGCALRIEARRPLLLAADGEPLPARQTVEVRVRPAALRVVRR